MKRLIILAPGVATSKVEALTWTAALARRLCGPEDGYATYRPGWIFPPAVRFAAYRRHYVRGFQRFVADAVLDYRPKVVDCVTHSFGGWMAWRGMQDSGGPQAVFRRLVLMAPPVSSRSDPASVLGHVDRVACLHSREDEVIRFSTLGMAGCIGFAAGATAGSPDANGAVLLNYDLTPLEHGDYTRPGPAWGVAEAFLNG